MKNFRKLSLLFIIGIFWSCNDYEDLKKEDVLKYSWLKPFIFSNKEFEGSHNLDLGIMEFQYEYLDSYQDFIEDINDVIIDDGWEQVSHGNNYRIIKKKIEIYENYNKPIKVEIIMDSVNSIVKFKIR